MSEYKLQGGNLINEHEVARILGNKITTVRNWRQTGKGPAFTKIGRSVRYSPASVEAFLAKRQSEDEQKAKNAKMRRQKKLQRWASFVTRKEHV